MLPPFVPRANVVLIAGKIAERRRVFEAHHSDNFPLLAGHLIGTSDIHKLELQCDASDESAGADFVIKAFHIWATKMTNGK